MEAADGKKRKIQATGTIINSQIRAKAHYCCILINPDFKVGVM